MPCPHCRITIIKRSENESAVSAAAYQSGEKLFSEYHEDDWYSLVDYATVYGREDIRFTFKNRMEIKA